MGWITIHTVNKNKKAVIESEIISGVVKSVMKGNIYYGAVKDGEEIYAVVILTKYSTKEYFNFSYKIITDDMGPNEFECPTSILNILTPTTSKEANEWRNKCREYQKKKKELNELPFGAEVEVRILDSIFRVTKERPAYQYKNWFWMTQDGYAMPKKYVTPNNTKILSKKAI